MIIDRDNSYGAVGPAEVCNSSNIIPYIALRLILATQSKESGKTAIQLFEAGSFTGRCDLV